MSVQTVSDFSFRSSVCIQYSYFPEDIKAQNKKDILAKETFCGPVIEQASDWILRLKQPTSPQQFLLT